MVAKRPNSKRNLDMALRRMGGADEEFVRRRTLVANAIVGNLMPAGAVKGGSAMKIRFGDKFTRASTDFDAARQETLEIFLRELGDALAEGWEGFEGRVVPKQPAHPTSSSSFPNTKKKEFARRIYEIIREEQMKEKKEAGAAAKTAATQEGEEPKPQTRTDEN
ncbi:MAG TPA: hypothetical protein DCP91_00315 [Eggerthellaceae bacterium]|nr:hypothetical protein [Eggerthellaceae bacterium]